nr:precorrin-3B C(17)-methyltransferase [Thermincola potens]
MRTGGFVGNGQSGETDFAENLREGCNGGNSRGYLAVIGIGPGDLDQMSIKAYRTLQQVEVIVGYKTYIDLVAELVKGKEVISSGMMKEVDRCQKAIEIALQKRSVAVISSGDPGIYGMAGVVLELALKMGVQEAIDIEIIPGITSANAAAASLGAPLMHDFAVISLSDLLTPWETIVQRLEYAAQGDFVTVLYNPVSKKRTEQIKEAQRIFLKYKPGNTPVGIVRNAKRGNEEVTVSTLAEFLKHPIDMFTVVLIGNNRTFSSAELMITPRGYSL